GAGLMSLLYLAPNHLHPAIYIGIGGTSDHFQFVARQSSRLFLPDLNQGPATIRISGIDVFYRTHGGSIDLDRFFLNVEIVLVSPVKAAAQDRLRVTGTPLRFRVGLGCAGGIRTERRVPRFGGAGPGLVGIITWNWALGVGELPTAHNHQDDHHAEQGDAPPQFASVHKDLQ